MKAPPHLDGLLNVLAATEAACEGTGYEWLLRSDARGGYFANITRHTGAGDERFPEHASTPTAALATALTKFNLRTRSNK